MKRLTEEERLKEWFIRYTRIFNKRYTSKQKSLFLEAVVSDLKGIRDDVKVHTYIRDKGPKGPGRNVYVGRLKKADMIICTYYDTPLIYKGDYAFFDKASQKKKTVLVQVVLSTIYLILGILLASLLTALQLSTFLLVVFYGLYLIGLLKITRGIAENHTDIRNSSSLLVVLQCAMLIKQPTVAFALVDNGCGNESGLDKVLSLKKKGTPVYCLDSIGSDLPLYSVQKSVVTDLETQEVKGELAKEAEDKTDVSTIVSAYFDKDRMILDKGTIKAPQLNVVHFNKVFEYLELLGRTQETEES